MNKDNSLWKYIDTKGICNIELLEGSTDWYWGSDYVHGDLYEAEELFQGGHAVAPNRLIFIKYPEGTVYEPVKATKGQYMDAPICYQNEIFWLLVDFIKKEILIYRCSQSMDEISVYATIALDEVEDCYNLKLALEPLMLIRQGHENTFQIVWPDKVKFPVDSTETFFYRENNRLIFTKWYEDLDYREDVIVRELPTGKVVEVMNGCLIEMPNGETWVLK